MRVRVRVCKPKCTVFAWVDSCVLYNRALLFVYFYSTFVYVLLMMYRHLLAFNFSLHHAKQASKLFFRYQNVYICRYVYAVRICIFTRAMAFGQIFASFQPPSLPVHACPLIANNPLPLFVRILSRKKVKELQKL